MRRTLTTAACLIGVALALSACGALKTRINPVASKAQPISLELADTVGALQAGIFTARSDGALTRAGIDLHLSSAPSTEQALADVAAGRTDVAVASEPEVMLARNRHVKVTSFAAVTQGPQATIVSIVHRRRRAITSVRSLRGSRVGVSGLASEAALFSTMLHRAGVPTARVTRVDVQANPTAGLLSGRIDAYYGAQAPEVAAALRARHRRVAVVPAARLGLLRYDGVVLATGIIYYASHQNELRRLAQAIGRGYAALRRDPATGLSALAAGGLPLDPAISRTVLTEELPDLFPGAGHPWGWQDISQWNAFGRFLTSEGVTSVVGAWDGAGTNNLLAGQGP